MKNHHSSHPAPKSVAVLAEPEANTQPLAAKSPTHDQIAQRAYAVYLESGSKKGHCKQNWRQAEESLHASAAACASSK